MGKSIYEKIVFWRREKKGGMMKRDRFLKSVLGFLVVMAISLSLGYAQEAAIGKDILISVDELARIVNDPNVRIIDGRPPKDYGLSHIKNAINIWHKDLYDPSASAEGMILPPSELEKKLRDYGINNENTIVFYCVKSKMAGRLFWIFDYLGHKNLKILSGGIGMWKRKNHPVTTEVPSFGRGNFTANPNPSLIVTKDYVNAHLGDPNVVIIDARSKAEYDGRISKVAQAGHIPGAINIEWESNIKPTGEFKPISELKKLYEGKGVTKDKEVIGYCCTSVRFGNTYAVLRYLLGYPNVKVYDGAFYEWGADTSTPVEK